MSEIRRSTNQLNYFKKHQVEQKKEAVREAIEEIDKIESEVDILLNSLTFSVEDEDINQDNEVLNKVEDDLEMLRDAVSKLKPDFAYTVLRDNMTRWNSIRRLLERAYTTRTSVDATTREYNHVNRLTSVDWDNILLLV